MEQEEANPWEANSTREVAQQHQSFGNRGDQATLSLLSNSVNVSPGSQEGEELDLEEDGAAGSSNSDIVIAVMGVTGAGKSTFISILADQDVTVGHDLVSCTVNVGVYSFTHHSGRTVYLVDTPGFDDTTRSDTEILKEIAYFFAKMHIKGMHLSGIIYLHRITDPRIGGSALKNLRMFDKLCGKACLPNVVLTTTMWSSLNRQPDGPRIGAQRQDELQSPHFWGPLVAAGSKIVRHDGTPDSAWAIVEEIVSLPSKIVLDIQTELVDRGKSLEETEAGKHLQSELLEVRKQLAKELAEYQKEMEAALSEGDQETIQMLKKEKETLQAKERQQSQDRRKLEITMADLSREKDVEWDARAEAMSLAVGESGGRQSIGDGTDGISNNGQVERESTTVRRELEWLKESIRENERQHELEIARLRLSHEAEAVVQVQRLTEESMLMQVQYRRDREALERRLKHLERKKKRENPIVAFYKLIFKGIVSGIEPINSIASSMSMGRDERHLAY